MNGEIQFIRPEEKYTEIIEGLTDKDDRAAYEYTRKIAAESEASSGYYPYLDTFASLLADGKSYIRTRAFILCCSQARWDTEGRIKGILPDLLALLHDPKPTVVRQCLNAIKEIVVFRPELCADIEKELAEITLSQYKDSMIPLIQKDIERVKELLEEQKK